MANIREPISLESASETVHKAQESLGDHCGELIWPPRGGGELIEDRVASAARKETIGAIVGAACRPESLEEILSRRRAPLN